MQEQLPRRVFLRRKPTVRHWFVGLRYANPTYVLRV
jgi:hypothetical protein